MKLPENTLVFDIIGLEPWDSAVKVGMEIGSDINTVGVLRLRIRKKQSSHEEWKYASQCVKDLAFLLSHEGDKDTRWYEQITFL
jgi:hypothetical protein